MPTLEQNIRQAIHESLLRGEDPQTVAAFLASVVNEIAGRRLLRVEAGRTAVLTVSEIAALERLSETLPDRWFTAKAVWLALRPGQSFTHGASVLLGKQLALRYAKQRKSGPTRLYWIATPAIAEPKA